MNIHDLVLWCIFAFSIFSDIKWPVKGQIVFHKVRTNLPSSQLFVSLFKCQLWIPKLILLGLRLISNGLCFLAPPWGIRDLSSLAGDGTCVPWQWKSRVLTTGPPGKSQGEEFWFYSRWLVVLKQRVMWSDFTHRACPQALPPWRLRTS